MKEALNGYAVRDDILTTVPTWVLIEDIQALRRALACADNIAALQEQVYTTIQCLEETVANHTCIPHDVKFIPSGSSLILPSEYQGIVTQNGGWDITCPAGKPVSDALLGGVCQCTEECPHFLSCFLDDGEPRYGRIPPMEAAELADATDEKIMEHLNRMSPQ